MVFPYLWLQVAELMDSHGLYTMFAGQLYAVWQKMKNDQKLIEDIVIYLLDIKKSDFIFTVYIGGFWQ